MVVIITASENQSFYDSINTVNRYNFHFTKARQTNELCEEIDRLQTINCFIIDYDAIPKEEISYFLEWTVEQATTLVVATGLTSYDMMVQDFYASGVVNVLTSSGQELAKNIVDFLSENIQATPTQETPTIHLAKKPTHQEMVFPIQKEEVIQEAQNMLKQPFSEAPVKSVGNGRYRASTIALAGAGRRMGTTTQIFQIAYYLQSLLKDVAILDMQENSLISKLNGEHAGIAQIKKCQYRIYGIDYYVNPLMLASLKSNYDFVLLDYGNFQAIPDITAFIEKDVHILVCGCKAWEEKELQDSFSFDSGQTKYLFSFVSKQKEAFVLSQMADLSPRTYFAPYAPEVEKYCGNDALYQTLTGERSFTKENPLQEKKKNFFFRKRRAE